MKATRRPGRQSYVKDVTGTSVASPGDPGRVASRRRNPGRGAAHQGVVVKSLEGAVVADDGRDILVTLQRAKGEAIMLALPVQLIQGLIVVLAHSFAKAQRKRSPAGQRQVMASDRIRLFPGPDGRLVASIGISGGAELSFLLPESAAHELAVALETLKRDALQPPGSAAVRPGAMSDSDQLLGVRAGRE